MFPLAIPIWAQMDVYYIWCVCYIIVFIETNLNVYFEPGINLVSNPNRVARAAGEPSGAKKKPIHQWVDISPYSFSTIFSFLFYLF